MFQFYLSKISAAEITPNRLRVRLGVRNPIFTGGAAPLNPNRLQVRLGVRNPALSGGSNGLNPGRLEVTLGVRNPTFDRQDLPSGSPLKYNSLRFRPEHSVGSITLSPKQIIQEVQ